MSNPHKFIRLSFKITVYIFAIIGFVLVVVYTAVESGLTKTSGVIDNQHDYFKNQAVLGNMDNAWEQGDEWQVLKAAITKDQTSIASSSQAAGVPARMIVALLVVEQLRLFHSDRELFKTAFAPLKILANQSQFSWGVMGIKQDTARMIEGNLQNPVSPFYPGPVYAHLLDFTTADPDTERFDRLTDANDRSFSYLYAGLFIKEIEAQWQKAGMPIDNRPDIIATLYDIGFNDSHPNSNPQSGGAEIDIGTSTYSFGGLAESFYQSSELADAFPVE